MMPRLLWLPLSLTTPACLSCCVAAGTRVRTARGAVPAGELAVGDCVESVDVGTGRAMEGRIVAIRRARRECLALRWSGGSLVCTPEHPLYSPEVGAYRPASDWVMGDARYLLARTGNDISVVEVDAVEAYAGVHEVVDLALAAEPRNFVAEGIVVHNKSPADLPATVIEGKGPVVTLTAAEPVRQFVVRLCHYGEDLYVPGRSIHVVATATVILPPDPGNVLWLSMYAESAVDEFAVVDGAAPGELRQNVELPPESCSGGLVVTLERLAEPPEGSIAVRMRAIENVYLHDPEDIDDWSLTIEALE